jgi:hypothetical protein
LKAALKSRDGLQMQINCEEKLGHYLKREANIENLKTRH